ncbi:MAG: response regulator transcription factor, partial [Chloroflexota bacterium]|nr:response regulator transcription factor [Chloroflexota bacterium]
MDPDRTPPSPPLRVLLADDHTVVRHGVRAYLGLTGDITVVGEAGDGREAVRLARELAPDVVLMDLAMPELDGVAATAAIKAERREIEIIVLTSFLDEEHVIGALKAGAIGYLLKDAEPDEVIRAIRAAGRGEA